MISRLLVLATVCYFALGDFLKEQFKKESVRDVAKAVVFYGRSNDWLQYPCQFCRCPTGVVQTSISNLKVFVMSLKNVASVAVFVVAVAFSIQLVCQTGVEARPASYQAVAAPQQTNTIVRQQVEYARLRVEADGDQVTWLIGGNGQVRTESLRQAYQRLGGRGRSTFANMLDQIGSLGWSLVEVNGNTWIFTRRVS